MRALLIAIAVLAFTAVGDTSAVASSHCGGVNETPCKVWERVPSCDAGLVEDFAKGKCVSKAKPTPCGKEGQRPCLVTERIPSCDANLMEKGGRCVKPAGGQCGALGQRPCLVTERIPSCNQGLAEDFAQHKCVVSKGVAGDLRTAGCHATVGAIRAAKTTPALAALLPAANQRQSALQNRLRQDPGFKDRLLNQIATGLEPHTYAVPELKRIAAWLNNPSNRSALDSMFSTENFCKDSVAVTDGKLRQLGLIPKFAAVRPASTEVGHVYMGYQLTFGAGVGAGFQVGLMGVTDFQGRGAKYWFIGPQLITNAAVGLVGEVVFYPQATLEDFNGWSGGLGVSAGPFKVVQGAVDVMMDESFSRFEGFGFGPGVGLGVSPVDLAASVTHAWKY